MNNNMLLESSKLYGNTEDAVRLVHTRHTKDNNDEKFAVEVATGVDNRIGIVGVSDGVLQRVIMKRSDLELGMQKKFNSQMEGVRSSSLAC
jgi:hypothetical protein